LSYGRSDTTVPQFIKTILRWPYWTPCSRAFLSAGDDLPVPTKHLRTLVETFRIGLSRAAADEANARVIDRAGR